MYTNGSSAYQLEPSPQRRQQQAARLKAKKKKQRKSVRLSGMLCLVCAFAIAFSICARYVKIYGMHNQVEQKMKQLEALRAENEQKAIAVNSMLENSRIESYAVTQLGLQKVDSKQVVALQGMQGDRMSKVAKNVEKPAVKGFFGIFSGVSEYSK